jgi:hypothetical protein
MTPAQDQKCQHRRQSGALSFDSSGQLEAYIVCDDDDCGQSLRFLPEQTRLARQQNKAPSSIKQIVDVIPI